MFILSQNFDISKEYVDSIDKSRQRVDF